MIDRRKFLLSTLGAALGLGIPAVGMGKSRYRQRRVEGPVIISTWQHGIAANQEAWEALIEGRSVLDAVEAGVKVSEADPSVNSVGFGGLPDSNGEVTLDACIMNSDGDAGAVACLKQILHPVSVAKLDSQRQTCLHRPPGKPGRNGGMKVAPLKMFQPDMTPLEW